MDDRLVSLIADASEDRVGRSWLSAARTWTEAVKGRVLGPHRAAGAAPDAVMVLSDNGLWVEQLNSKVRPSILDVVRSAYRAATGKQPPGGFDQSDKVTRYLDQSINRMVNTPDEVYRRITKSLAEGVAAGESVPDLAARVDEILTVTGNDNWTNRSVTVARTEVTAAQNVGALAAGAQRAITERQPMVKTWVATTRPPSSSRTRPDHLEADGQTVPLTEPFLIGGHRMQFPGDPSGPADEVINCRCSLIVRAAGEAPTSTVDHQNPAGGNP